MSKKPTQVKTTTHQEKRVNIPTQETSDFMTTEQRAPKPILYPRRTELDPQLVWRGKDEQDSEPLEVLSKPIYTQEKIHPLAIIENVKAQAKAPTTTQFSMFSDFNGIKFEDQIDFYQHEQNWQNRLILGDSLQVMTSLADREGLKGKVQTIYLDPPYGIKFGSNWQVSTRERSVKDAVQGLTRQPEQVKAFRDTWELGIHSYLAYLRDRLTVARELLTETGSIFVQISDANQHLVRSLLDEVFGSRNFVAQIVFRKKKMPLGAKYLEYFCDYILFYAKNYDVLKYRQVFTYKNVEGDSKWSFVELDNGEHRKITPEEHVNHKHLPPNAKVYLRQLITPAGFNNTGVFPVNINGHIINPPSKKSWKTSELGMKRLLMSNRVELSEDDKTLNYILKLNDYPVTPFNSLWADTSGAHNQQYVVETSTTVIQRCLLMTTDPGDLVLDPTCGSGTTAYVAEQWGRRWITTDTSRVALALARTRLMSAMFPYYELTDPAGKDLRQGFNYKKVSHITLGDIANNPDIDQIHAKWQKSLEPLHGRLNILLKQNWQEWEVPREAAAAWPLEAQNILKDYWQKRQARQREMDDSISRNSEQETLYDQPKEVSNVVRVTGPFTVESLSPFKPISPAVASQQPAAEQQAQTQGNSGKFEAQILENLRAAGVQNSVKGERIEFDLLEPHDGGLYVQAVGEYTDKQGQSKGVMVAIGPEHGTVGKDFIKSAASEAVRGLGTDLLLVCAFSFDGEVSEEAKQYGRLTVLPVRMNPDLTMASLLKKTDKANLFMVFGEPDLTVTTKGKQVTVTLNGLDIYDPTTGEIRNNSVKDIACWFIDTDYNSHSFFVKQAYFTGEGEPYEKLKRALKADINEEAWQTLYRNESVPFDVPTSGKIAIKVINHYGDEVMKVWSVK